MVVDAVCQAIMDRNLPHLRSLLASGASPDGEITDPVAPLFLVVLQGTPPFVETLLDASAELSPIRHDPRLGWRLTPLMYACMHGKAEAIELLMSRHVELPVIPEQDDNSWAPLTPMLLACLFAQPESVRTLLRHNCPTDTTIQRDHTGCVHGDSALNWALKQSVGLVVLRFVADADDDDRCREDVRAAAAKECAELILAKRRADEPSIFSAKHQSDLFCSCSMVGIASGQKLSKMVKILLDARVDPNLRAGTACKALHKAGHDDVMLRAACGQMPVAKSGPTALEYACRSCVFPIVIETLLKGGAVPTDAAQEEALRLQTERSFVEVGAAAGSRDADDVEDGEVEDDQAQRWGGLIQEMLFDARSAHLRVGQRVRLRGLDREDLNGRIGRLAKAWPGVSRRAVRLAGDKALVSIRTDNLEMLHDGEGEEMDGGAAGTPSHVLHDGSPSHGEVIEMLLQRKDDDPPVSAEEEVAPPERRSLLSSVSSFISRIASSAYDGDAGGSEDFRLSSPEGLGDDGLGTLKSLQLPDYGDDDCGRNGSSDGGKLSSKKERDHLFRAASSGDATLLGTLLRARASPEAVDANGNSLLRAAMSKGPAAHECVKLLLDAQADPNRPGDRQSNSLPLGIAAMMGFHDLVELLVGAGAWPGGKEPGSLDADLSNDVARVPILASIQVLGMLLKNLHAIQPEDLDASPLPGQRLITNGEGTSPMGLKFSTQSTQELASNCLRCFVLMLTNTEDRVLKLHCLHQAAKQNNAGGVRVIQILVDDGVDPDATVVQQVGRADVVTGNALMQACAHKAARCVEALLAAGANPSASHTVTGENGQLTVTPMTYAKDRATIALLVEALQKGQNLVGERVRVEGYRRAKPALNGKSGEVRSFDPSTGQCKVHLDFGKNSTRSHDLPPTVLMPLDGTETDDGCEEDMRQSSPGSSNGRAGDEAEGGEQSHGNSSLGFVDVGDGLAMKLCETLKAQPAIHTAELLAAGYHDQVNWEYVNTDDGGEYHETALRAAVLRLRANRYQDEDIHALALVIAAGADLDQVMPDGWCWEEAIAEDEDLAALSQAWSRAARKPKRDPAALVESMQHRWWNRCILEALMDLEASANDLSHSNQVLLSSVYPAPAACDHGEILNIAFVLGRAEDVSFIVGPPSKELSLLYLAYEHERPDAQPTLMLQMLVAAGADWGFEVDRSADDDWKDERWTLYRAAVRREDEATLDWITSICDSERERNVLLLPQSPSEVQGVEEAVSLLIRDAADLSESFAATQEFMSALPRAVRLRTVTSVLCKRLAEEFDAGFEDNEAEAVIRRGLRGHLLCYAASKDDEAAVTTLLGAHADPAFQASDSLNTALIEAVANGNKRLVEVLITAGSPYACKSVTRRTRTRARMLEAQPAHSAFARLAMFVSRQPQRSGGEWRLCTWHRNGGWPH